MKKILAMVLAIMMLVGVLFTALAENELPAGRADRT